MFHVVNETRLNPHENIHPILMIFAVASFLLGCLCGSILFGPMADKYGRYCYCDWYPTTQLNYTADKWGVGRKIVDAAPDNLCFPSNLYSPILMKKTLQGIVAILQPVGNLLPHGRQWVYSNLCQVLSWYNSEWGIC